MIEHFKNINIRHLLTDILFAGVTFFLSLYLRVQPSDAQIYQSDMLRILPVVLVTRAIFFIYFETYNIIWRYVSAVDAFKLGKAISGSSLVIVCITYLFKVGNIPRSLYFIDAFILLSVLTGVRLSRRLYHEYKRSIVLKKYGEKTLVYGAGVAGQGILKRLIVDKELKLHVVGFLDDDNRKIGKSIS
jgi:FlaA1/EpsC-like NDP-sugar epimerase